MLLGGGPSLCRDQGGRRSTERGAREAGPCAPSSELVGSSRQDDHVIL